MTLWDELYGWIPARLVWQDGEACVEWLWAGISQPADPVQMAGFYDHWLADLGEHPFNQLFRRVIPLTTLKDQAVSMPEPLPLTGYLLHMSRCGSTLAVRMLASQPQNRVISEPYILQYWLSGIEPDLHTYRSREEIVDTLRFLVKLLGLPHSRHEQRLLIKFDALAAIHLDVLSAAFPDTPWVFLYRQPEEVLVSQSRDLAAAFVPGALSPQVLNCDYAWMLGLPLPEYLGLVLGRICQTALEYLPQNGLAVNYTSLPSAVWQEIASHFRFAPTASDIEVMRKIARFNAKNPESAPFQSDSTEKRASITPDYARAANQWLLDVYAQLEQARMLQAKQEC